MTHDIHMAIEIASDQARVFDALVDRDDLRAWFSEDADISPEQKRYDFWGRLTPETPTRETGRHPLIVFEEPRHISYDWTIRDGPSTVSLVLGKSKAGTALELHHRLGRGRAVNEGALSDFWGSCLERLKAWLEHGRTGYFPDYAMAPANDLTMSVLIDGSADEIFRTLVEPSRVEQYLAMPGKAAIDPRVGGRYDIGWDEGGPRTILAFEPGKRLAYSWNYKPEPETAAVWTVESAGAATRLTIVHSGFGESSRHEPYLMGWGFFLNRIKLLVEVKQGRAAVSTADDYKEATA